jgi:hypothetical protein
MLNGTVARLLIAVTVCVGFNAALTFRNAWPSLWVAPGAGLSVELLVVIALLALYLERRPAMGRLAGWCLTAFLFLLIVGRYFAVTAHALFGRSINLYFDVPHLPEVVAMTAGARSVWEILFFSVVALALPAAMLLLIRWGIGALARCFADVSTRRLSAGLATAGILAFAAAFLPGLGAVSKGFARPISPVYAQQVEFAADALFGPETPDFLSQPAVEPDVATLKGADVFVLFLESYGEVAYRVPEISADIRTRAEQADRSLRAKGWYIASGFFTSPTFGGGSWLAHSSFLAGAVVSQNRDYQLLLSSNRHTFVRSFERAGYRTVALMPGLKLAWPEGQFYGFDKIYDASTLGYAGPAFGWWTIPDQFTLGRFAEREMQVPNRKPLFVVYPTVMSHMPFTPVPPYLPDWTRALDPTAYAGAAHGPVDSLGDWKAARGSYRRAMLYDIALVEGFLAEEAPKDALVVALGDHQPPGIVSGAGATWLVPVHIFSRDENRIAAFRKRGFRDGFVPAGGSLGDFALLHRKVAEALK